MQFGGVNSENVIGAFTTFFFWGLGDVFVDWYLTFLLYLYLLFPLLYKIIIKWGLCATVIVSFLSLIYVWYCPHPWFHESAFCRVPIFLSGIYLYKSRNSVNSVFNILLFYAILVLYSFITNKVCLTYYIAPFVMVILFIICFILKKINYLHTCLSWIGKYTLELYVANCIIMSLQKLFGINNIAYYEIYFLGTFIIAFILNRFNYLIRSTVCKI